MKMRTTVTLDDDVAAQLERAMRESGRGFKQALNETLRRGFARHQETKALQPFEVRARALGVVPGLDYSDTSELLEVAEGPAHR